MNYQLIIPHWAISTDTGAIDMRHAVVKTGDDVTPITEVIAGWLAFRDQQKAETKVPAGCVIGLAHNQHAPSSLGVPADRFTGFTKDTTEVEEEEPSEDEDPSVRRNAAQAETYRVMYGTSDTGLGDHIPRFIHPSHAGNFLREDHVVALLKANQERKRGMYSVPAGANVCYGYFDETGFKHAIWHDKTALDTNETMTKGYFVPFDYVEAAFTSDMQNRGMRALEESNVANPLTTVRRIYEEMESVRPVRDVEDAWKTAVREALNELGREDAFQIKEPAVAIEALLAAKAHDVRSTLDDVCPSDAPARNPENYTRSWLLSVGYDEVSENLSDCAWTLSTYSRHNSVIQIYEHRGIRLMHRNDDPSSYYVLEHPHPRVLTNWTFCGTSRAILNMLADGLPQAGEPVAQPIRDPRTITEVLLTHAQFFDEAADVQQNMLDTQTASADVHAYRRGRRNAFRRAAMILRGEPGDEEQ